MACQPVLMTAACDGACRGNPGPGGWACLLRFSDGREEETGGFEPQTTNNRMELQAALWLLQRSAELPRKPGFAIRTDSRYLIDGYTRWLPGWKRKGWRTAAGKPVLNRDLWEALDAARLEGVAFQHVKGHSGDPDNERVDALAVAFSQGREPGPNSRNGPATVRSTAVGVASATRDATGPTAAQSSANAAAPAFLRNLLDLGGPDIAQHLASRGFGFTLAELAQLTNQPLAQLKQHRGAWPWRDWLVAPGDDGLWRLVPHHSAGKTRNCHSGLAG